MPVGLPLKTTYANGDVFSSSDVNDTNGTVNLVGQSLNFYAGKNKIINGDFEIWQRGTSFSPLAGGAYFADRWVGQFINGTINVTRQTFTPGTAPVVGYEGEFFAQLVRTATHATIADYIAQRVEDVRTFAAQTVTISFWARVTSGTKTLGMAVTQNFGSGGSGEVSTATVDNTITTTWTRYTATIAVPSISGKTIGTSSWIAASFVIPVSAGNFTLQIWGVQMEQGSTATAFQTATGTIQGELAACQRYLPFIIGRIPGYAYNSTNAYLNARFAVPTRVAPTGITLLSAVSAMSLLGPTLASGVPSSVSFNDASVNSCNIVTATSAGSPTMASGQGATLETSNGILFTGCEL